VLVAYDVAGKRVVITGASTGIGASMATGMAARGATVGICARRAGLLRAVLDECRSHAPGSQMWVVDLEDLDAASAFATEAAQALGGVDILVNNAGMPKRRTIAALQPGDAERVMNLNYSSPVRIITALLPTLLESGRASGTTAHVVNISSVAARLSPPGEAVYAASKAALTSFSEALAIELWDQPVDVHIVNPGVVDTELFDPNMPDNDQFVADDVERLPPSAVLDAVLDALDQGSGEIYVPAWFADVAKVKVDDLPGYMAGAFEYWHEKSSSSS
jgi:short-subunit dehydrogenase